MIKYTKKIIILSPAKNAFSPARDDDLKGVLIIEKTALTINASLRLYNFTEQTEHKYMLAITDSIGNKYKITIIPNTNSIFNFNLDKNINLDGKLTAVFVSVLGDAVEPLIWGSADSNSSPEKDFEKLLQEFKTEISQAESSFATLGTGIQKNKIVTTNIAHPISVENDEFDSQEDIDKIIDNEFEKYPKDDILFRDSKKLEEIIFSETKVCEASAKCEECIYKENFYNGVKITGKQERDKQAKEKFKEKVDTPNENKTNFFNIISLQIDTLFEKYPPETILQELLPNSKWVKVDYEGKGDYYAIGLLYQEDKIKYIAYAVPSEVAGNQPDELKGISQWFPINVMEPNGKGYFIMYQDADSGDGVAFNSPEAS
ncbi:MAG: hypothetical protein WCX32_03260 [Clostridia bacterium]|nr:hypothetical protein [Clostridia bacterium]MDD4275497.1 hypothetical protein [Clostridia bacterium]